MLKDRIKITGTGFRVFWDGESQRRVYYGEFTLKDGEEDEVSMTETAYWDPVRAAEVILDKNQCFIAVTEKEDDKVVEEYRFFFSNRNNKPELAITMKPKRAYGKNAYMITVEWVECKAEPINSRYIYLTDAGKEKYGFLKKWIEPLEPDGKRLLDRYVFALPQGEKIENYSVEVDPLVRQKYRITD